jgi:2-phospho-L-lactate guanylyltransferase
MSTTAGAGPLAATGRTSAWGAVIALKPTSHAKSRLASLPDPLRRRLAWTMAVDTLTAVRAAVGVVVVVGNQPGLGAALRAYGLLVTVVAEPARAGLNTALTHGELHLRQQGHDHILACVGDLPALSTSSLEAVLRTAGRLPRAFLPDASGVGTTMAFTTTWALDPHFQGRSSAAHRSSGAIPLTDETIGAAVPDARRDVDSELDLAEAYLLGVGRLTAALFDPTTADLGRYTTVTVADNAARDDDHVAITAEGYRVRLPGAAVDGQLRALAVGQRLHVMVADDLVLSAWL